MSAATADALMGVFGLRRMVVLAVDPGPVQSGVVRFDGTRTLFAGVMPNEDVLKIVADDAGDALAIEKIVSYGNIVGSEVFDTCQWAGRFQQAWSCPDEVHMVRRLDVKKSLGLPGSSNDKQVRDALLRVVGPKGTKASPGPCYGVASHSWAALGVAYAAYRMMGER